MICDIDPVQCQLKTTSLEEYESLSNLAPHKSGSLYPDVERIGNLPEDYLGLKVVFSRTLSEGDLHEKVMLCR